MPELFATVDPDNTSSLAVLERLGFSVVLSRLDAHGQQELLYRLGSEAIRAPRV